MILLDTHVLVRYMCNEGKLGKRALSTLDRAVANDELFVSAISFWEVATLVAKAGWSSIPRLPHSATWRSGNGAREQVLPEFLPQQSQELGSPRECRRRRRHE